jgi:hypothetical protein
MVHEHRASAHFLAARAGRAAAGQSRDLRRPPPRDLGGDGLLLVFAIEPCLRSLSGHLKPVTAMGTPPGEALNWWVFPVLVLLLLMSLCPSDGNWQGPSRESSSSR